MHPTNREFLKGHGTENDFVLLPDHDGRSGPASPDLVRALCDRRSGLGADGVIRVVRTDADDDPAAVRARGRAEWFMDYRNHDGSLSEMCGNGVRVLGRYLAERAGVAVDRPVPVATRAGIKVLAFAGGRPDGAITVDMGEPRVGGETRVGVGHGPQAREWVALHVDMGNPHAVAFVDDLGHAGPLLEPPDHDPDLFPDGVNVEFVTRVDPGRVSLRVHERGSGETRSCGTGACAAMVAAALADGGGPGTAYRVDVPGGTLGVEWTSVNRILLTGPAVLVAEGNWLAGG